MGPPELVFTEEICSPLSQLLPSYQYRGMASHVPSSVLPHCNWCVYLSISLLVLLSAETVFLPLL